jgi:hypothetical protein
MPGPTIEYFGQLPTTIVLKTTDNFNGSAMTGTPVITPALYTFPAQAGGGEFDFHNEPIDVKNISYGGLGTLSIYKVVGGKDVLLATLSPTSGEMFENTTLSPGEKLKFVSAGSGASVPAPAVVAVTSSLTSGFWGT